MRIPGLVCFVIGISFSYSQNAPFHTFQISGAGNTSNGSTRLVTSLGQPILVSGKSSASRFESGFLAVKFGYGENFPPLIVFNAPGRIKSGDIFTATITDLDGIDKAWLCYRPIAVQKFDSVEFDFTASTYQKTITEQWYDGIGMEYYLSATDKTNKRSVLKNSTSYFRSYVFSDNAFLSGSMYISGSRSQKDYRIISVPFNFSNASIGEQFDELANNEGQHSKSNYRIATYAGGNNWIEYPDAALTEFKRGVGYWFLTTIQGQINFSLANVAEEHQGNLFSMALKPGWNQIGNPYPIAISWEDVRAYNDGLDIKKIKTFNGSFVDGDILQPYQGGFVNYGGASSVTIDIPFQGQQSGGGRKKTNVFSNDISADAWTLTLNTLQDGHLNNIAAVGMHPDASIHADFFDDYHPPRFADFTEITFTNGTQNFAKDIVPRSEKHTWSFYVESSSKEPILLTWDNIDIGASDYDLFLIDESNAQLVDMRGQSTYPIRNGFSYRIVYGNDVSNEILPEHLRSAQPYPNPWLASNESFVTIPFAFADEYSHDVELKIVDFTGRIVQQLSRDGLRGGFHALQWNGNDYSGRACAAGIYVLRLTIKSAKGVNTFCHRLIIKG